MNPLNPLVITGLCAAILATIFLPSILIPKPVQGVAGLEAVPVIDVPVDEIPTRPVGPLTSLVVSPDAKAPVNRLQFTATDADGVAFRGSPEQLDGLIKAIDANIFDLRQKRAELVNIQTAISAEITKQGLIDPPATTTP